MKHLLVLACVFFTLISCKKTKDPSPNSPGNVISYDPLTTDIKIASIRTFDMAGYRNPYCKYPLPQDSSVVGSFDLDKDGEADYGFIVAHWRFKRQTACTHCDTGLIRSVRIFPRHERSFIATEKQFKAEGIAVLKVNDNITHDRSWSSDSLWVTAQYWDCGPQPSFAAFCYWGLKVNGKLGWAYADLDDHGLVIREFALNNMGKEIKAGQKN